jgi:hypothetical protein
MPLSPFIPGQILRYVLVLTLLDRREVLTVPELVAAVEAAGGRLDEDRPGKQVADALRWEVTKGRVRRAGRGRYTAGHVPRSTQWYFRRRVAEWQAWSGAQPRQPVPT